MLLTDETTRVPLADPIGRRRRQRRRSRILPGRATAPTCASGSAGQRSTRSTPSSATTSSTTRGRRSSPAACTAAEFLSFVEGFAAERDLAVWQAITIGLRGLGRLLDDADFAKFQQRVAALVGPVVDDLGDPSDDEDDLTGKLRGLVTGALAILGAHQPTIDRCRALYDQSVADPTSVDPELVAAATVGGRGDRRRRRLRAPARRRPSTARRRRISFATCTRSPSSTTRRSCCARASCASPIR